MKNKLTIHTKRVIQHLVERWAGPETVDNA